MVYEIGENDKHLPGETVTNVGGIAEMSSLQITGPLNLRFFS